MLVTEWRMAPGANTGWHRHGHDYVVVPLTDGKVKLDTKVADRPQPEAEVNSNS